MTTISQVPATRVSPPPWVAVAAAGIATHAFNHFSTVVQDGWRLIESPATAEFNPGVIYHPISAVLYVWLAVMVYQGRNWGRVVITIQLAGQFVGRYFIWMSYPALEVRADLATGWALSTVVLFLLWAPGSSRRYFRRR